MVDMFVEGVQGDVSWFYVLKVLTMSIAFLWILVQKCKYDGRRTKRYNRERAFRLAQIRSRHKKECYHA